MNLPSSPDTADSYDCYCVWENILNGSTGASALPISAYYWGCDWIYASPIAFFSSASFVSSFKFYWSYNSDAMGTGTIISYDRDWPIYGEAYVLLPSSIKFCVSLSLFNFFTYLTYVIFGPLVLALYCIFSKLKWSMIPVSSSKSRMFSKSFIFSSSCERWVFMYIGLKVFSLSDILLVSLRHVLSKFPESCRFSKYSSATLYL